MCGHDITEDGYDITEDGYDITEDGYDITDMSKSVCHAAGTSRQE